MGRCLQQSITRDRDADIDEPHVGVAGLLHRVVVDVDDAVQVASGHLREITKGEGVEQGGDLDNVVQLLKVICLGLGIDIHVEGNGGKVAHGDLVGAG
jgi:hypothetical protein